MQRTVLSFPMLCETEEQNDDGNQDNPKQNIFIEKITSAVHSVSPFCDTDKELLSAH